MPHHHRLIEMVGEALRAMGLTARYTVEAYRLHDLPEWRAASRPTTAEGSALQLQFTTTDNPIGLL